MKISDIDIEKNYYVTVLTREWDNIDYKYIYTTRTMFGEDLIEMFKEISSERLNRNYFGPIAILNFWEK